MKKSIFLSFFLSFVCLVAKAQQEVKFSKAEQAEIQKILGKDFTAVLGEKGQLAIVAPKSVSAIKSTPRGGFSGLPTNAANATFAAYEKAWVYRQSDKNALMAKLGQERFKQLETVMARKGVKF